MQFRGGWHCDGGLIKLVPDLPKYVKICAFYQDIYGNSKFDINPNLLTTSRFTIQQLLKNSLLPPDPDVLQRLFEQGEECATIWIEKVKVTYF